MREPRLRMLDEPSLGLAPIIVDQVLDVVQRLRAAGTTILPVERALEIADYGCVLQNGRMLGHGPAAEIAAGALVAHAYVGAARAWNREGGNDAAHPPPPRGAARDRRRSRRRHDGPPGAWRGGAPRRLDPSDHRAASILSAKDPRAQWCLRERAPGA
jgi:ABC-type multidrug transport system ATPase subunit